MAEETGQPGVRGVAHDAADRDREAGAGPGPGGEAGDGQHQPDDSRRSQLIAAAQARWISTLTDLGGRNTLLYYKDRRAGTLDLAGADPDMLERFCRTGSVRLTRLFGDADLRADAIRRVSLVIHGPPGTGKSQTIANLIAALVARGRKVLFVAEKRAAIDAVLSRLKSVDLGEAVLDIHEGTRDRQRIARGLGETLDLAQRTAAPEVTDLHRRLVDRQRRLNEHVAALHEAHEPWGLTPFEIQSALLGIPEQAHTPVRLAAPELITAGQAATADELLPPDRRGGRRGGGRRGQPGLVRRGLRVRARGTTPVAAHLAAELALPQQG
jgi:hypothetical protein